MRRFVRAKQPRDSQRARVYRAETQAFGAARANAGTCASIAVVRDYLHGVLADDWFRTEYGDFAYVKIKDGRGTRHAYSAYEAKARGVVFSFPRWARTKPVMLHELSHAASLRRYGAVAAHGPEFAATYLRLVSRHLGSAAHEKLREAFVVHRVSFE
ncbi:MAG: hypothetical protein ACRER1_08165 [Gammaproteobacteria bacterium]